MDNPDPAARLTLWASISPSEDPDKVAGALRRIAGGEGGETKLEEGSAIFLAPPVALVRLRDQLRDRHVRSAARRQFLGNAKRRSTSVLLNRQAAAVGVVALCGSPEESPLGPVHVKLESERLAEVIDWLTSYASG